MPTLIPKPSHEVGLDFRYFVDRKSYSYVKGIPPIEQKIFQEDLDTLKAGNKAFDLATLDKATIIDVLPSDTKDVFYMVTIEDIKNIKAGAKTADPAIKFIRFRQIHFSGSNGVPFEITAGQGTVIVEKDYLYDVAPLFTPIVQSSPPSNITTCVLSSDGNYIYICRPVLEQDFNKECSLSVMKIRINGTQGLPYEIFSMNIDANINVPIEMQGKYNRDLCIIPGAAGRILVAELALPGNMAPGSWLDYMPHLYTQSIDLDTKSIGLAFRHNLPYHPKVHSLRQQYKFDYEGSVNIFVPWYRMTYGRMTASNYLKWSENNQKYIFMLHNFCGFIDEDYDYNWIFMKLGTDGDIYGEIKYGGDKNAVHGGCTYAGSIQPIGDRVFLTIVGDMTSSFWVGVYDHLVKDSNGNTVRLSQVNPEWASKWKNALVKRVRYVNDECNGGEGTKYLASGDFFTSKSDSQVAEHIEQIGGIGIPFMYPCSFYLLDNEGTKLDDRPFMLDGNTPCIVNSFPIDDNSCIIGWAGQVNSLKNLILYVDENNRNKIKMYPDSVMAGRRAHHKWGWRYNSYHQGIDIPRSGGRFINGLTLRGDIRAKAKHPCMYDWTQYGAMNMSRINQSYKFTPIGSSSNVDSYPYYDNTNLDGKYSLSQFNACPGWTNPMYLQLSQNHVGMQGMIGMAHFKKDAENYEDSFLPVSSGFYDLFKGVLKGEYQINELTNSTMSPSVLKSLISDLSTKSFYDGSGADNKSIPYLSKHTNDNVFINQEFVERLIASSNGHGVTTMGISIKVIAKTTSGDIAMIRDLPGNTSVTYDPQIKLPTVSFDSRGDIYKRNWSNIGDVSPWKAYNGTSLYTVDESDIDLTSIKMRIEIYPGANGEINGTDAFDMDAMGINGGLDGGKGDAMSNAMIGKFTTNKFGQCIFVRRSAYPMLYLQSYTFNVFPSKLMEFMPESYETTVVEKLPSANYSDSLHLATSINAALSYTAN